MNISGNIMQTARSTPPKDVKPENMVFVNKAVELYMNWQSQLSRLGVIRTCMYNLSCVICRVHIMFHMYAAYCCILAVGFVNIASWNWYWRVTLSSRHSHVCRFAPMSHQYTTIVPRTATPSRTHSTIISRRGTWGIMCSHVHGKWFGPPSLHPSCKKQLDLSLLHTLQNCLQAIFTAWYLAWWTQHLCWHLFFFHTADGGSRSFH